MFQRAFERALITVDGLIPASIKGRGEEGLRRARLTVAMSLTFGSTSIGFGLLYWVLGATVPALVSLGGGLLLLAVPRILAGTGSARLAGIVLASSLPLLLAGFALATGGHHSPVLVWVGVSPIVAVFVGGRSGGVAATLALIAVALGLGVVEWGGVSLPSVATPGEGILTEGLMTALVPVVSLTLALSYDTTHEKMRQAVSAQNLALRRVLDNVGQGFLVADRSGRLVDEHSEVAERWFGVPSPGQTVWVYLAGPDSPEGEWLRLGWGVLEDGLLPLDLCISQLPRRLQRADRVMDIDYRPVEGPAGLDRVVIVVTDATAMVHAREDAADQQQLAVMLNQAARDPAGFAAFLEEAEERVRRLAPPGPAWRRDLHTLKAASGMFGAAQIAERCHRVEALSDEGSGPPVGELAELAAAWRALSEALRRVLPAPGQAGPIDERDLAELREAVLERAPHGRILELVEALAWVPARQQLELAADYTREVARRLGRSVEVTVADGGIRLPAGRLAGIWATLPHVLRNSADHGVEDAEVRVRAGKAPAGRIHLGLTREGAGLHLEVSDDGPGVDWDRLAARVGSSDRDVLYEALFDDGVSSRDELTEWSGRGVGLGAFRAAVREHGGEVTLHTASGVGTRVTAWIPVHTRQHADVRPLAAG